MYPQSASGLALIKCLKEHRKLCLDTFISFAHVKGSPFYNEDVLISRVRAATFLDKLAEYLPTSSMDELGGFFQTASSQLLAASFSYETVKLMYDLLEQSILEVMQDLLNDQPSFSSSVRSIKSAMQLARVIAVNQHISQVSAALTPPDLARNKTKTSSSSPAATYEPVVGSSYQTVEFTYNSNSSLRPTELATNNRASFPAANGAANQAAPASRPAPTNRSDSTPTPSPASSSSPLVGYLEWPLKPLPNTSPPEYKATLQNGADVNVLLVDNPRAYALHTIKNIRMVVCKVKQLGPIALAYP